MAEGYWGKILNVDLKKASFTIEEPHPRVYRRLLGGKGFIGYYLCREMQAGADPLSPSNILVFAPGLLTGSLLPGATKVTYEY